MRKRVEIEIAERIFSIETGRMARQADGAVLVQYGDTIVLVTAVAEKVPREGRDFFPLVVDYQEMTYAAGKIPGGFFKREGRPNEKEILTSRFIDRPIRPLFPKGYMCETQIIGTVLSVDQENDPDILAITGTSAALSLSDIPWSGPIGGVRVGRVDSRFICNPTYSQLKDSDINLIVVGSRDAIVMVEGGGLETPEPVLADAIMFGHQALQQILDIQDQLTAAAGKPKRAFDPPTVDAELERRLRELCENDVQIALTISDKRERSNRIQEIFDGTMERLGEEFSGREMEVTDSFDKIVKTLMRSAIVHEKRRIDGRGPKDIRSIDIQVNHLPRTHGSALFTRGETQAMVVTTLGTTADEQRVDTLTEDTTKSFMLHYKFPPFCVGEVKMLRSPSRREIGHGALAERALAAVLPPEEDFPYTLRVVSEILESNGSSSMATVCGGSLALMDAGVPVRSAVAGIAMGLIKEGEKVVILSDILGDEDHLGDMDFKVAGTSNGVTAFQMDVKITGITREILEQALEQAREGRMYILDQMNKVLERPRSELSVYAPRILSMQINPDRIRDLIGPAGKVIRGIVSETGVKIEVEDDGRVNIFSSDAEAAQKAVEFVKALTAEAQVGDIYHGKVKKIVDFGAFVEILPGIEGLIHISHLDHRRVQRVSDVLNEGDEVDVKVLDIDPAGKIRLSRKELLPQPHDSGDRKNHASQDHRRSSHRDHRSGHHRHHNGHDER
ncbi:MAG: polyribonucleotide nucleotidyltransferase [Deltaproteobacteria bacterium]|nr:polyribonucleotide nucleotidyltransferase [Deltaproteobacteria bacterium]MBW2308693.1 polyribonucleotide nucleotidyltransferase [Deltaproteobacteria bacterium]